MNRAAIALALLALTACASVEATRATGSPSAGLDETATFQNFRIRPIQVVEDSRCPINALCVWAGRLVVRVEIRDGAAPVITDLTLGRPHPVGGASVTLVSAEPSKLAGTPTNPSDYRFTFAVTRTP